jgi:dolichol-phosphate mannosyltransferase
MLPRGACGEKVMGKSVAIVVPAYNEEDCIEELARRLKLLFSSEAQYEFTCFLVENGSQDRTWHLIRCLCEADERFVGIQLARNFGAEGGMTAGLERVTQDAVIFMSADLQDPPESVHGFLRLWEQGFENVYGVITQRGGTGPIRKFNSEVFYWLVAKIADNAIPRNASDFRLLDRSVYEAVRQMRERGRFLRGMTAWVGFSSIGVSVERPQRFGGQSKATTQEVLKVATRGVFSNSVKPLRTITIAGFLLSVIALTSIIVLAALWLARGVPFAGFGSLVSLLLLAFGVLALMLGIVSEYVGLIYEEVKQRPNFIIRQTTDRPGSTNG